MERDQNVSLIQGLAHTGSFDFSRYDPLDPYHKARLQLALSFERRQRAITYKHGVFLYLLAVAATPGKNVKFETRRNVQEQAFDRLQSQYDLLFPWEPKKQAAGTATTTEHDIKALRDQWVSIWGDPNDPEVAAKIQRTADSLMKGTRLKRLRDMQRPKAAGS